ncbi:hypothetical protein AMTR_s00062p00061560 [Amborella trichopoda]|uniref:Isopenicillin N synthase-like Fe(2+) 2OG dioxygenase domain-containing protein n=1 Tax=Amborella trichopoda TaxID=13333 RepID=U5DBH3_AMBTC|nr:hypothetical protein AMTR_s00062p00061560 [Amborella trichopoda]
MGISVSSGASGNSGYVRLWDLRSGGVVWEWIKPRSVRGGRFGDSMAREERERVFSNGYYESLEHRVVVTTSQHRYSMAIVFGPASHVMVEPLKELVNELNPPKFKGFMWGKFYRFRRSSKFLKLGGEYLGARHFKINQ